MDRLDYSDPIIIAVTLTIPDPRLRASGGRWDLDTSRSPGAGERRSLVGGHVPPVLSAQFPAAALEDAAPPAAGSR